MKNVFGVQHNNNKIDGFCFITREISEDLANRQQRSSEALANFEKQAKLPLWLYIVKILAIAFATLFTILIIIIGAKNGFSKILNQSGWAIVVAVCLWLTFFSLVFIGRVRMREVVEDEDLHGELMRVESLVNECKEYLGIPNDAVGITVLGNFYKEKNDKKISELPFADFVALEMYIYVQNGKLYLADTGAVLCFEKSELVGYESSDQKIKMLGWTKKEHFSSEKYKPYKIMMDSNGVILFKGCLHAHFNRNGEEYEIIIPSYDSENFINSLSF